MYIPVIGGHQLIAFLLCFLLVCFTKQRPSSRGERAGGVSAEDWRTLWWLGSIWPSSLSQSMATLSYSCQSPFILPLKISLVLEIVFHKLAYTLCVWFHRYGQSTVGNLPTRKRLVFTSQVKLWRSLSNMKNGSGSLSTSRTGKRRWKN